MMCFVTISVFVFNLCSVVKHNFCVCHLHILFVTSCNQCFKWHSVTHKLGETKRFCGVKRNFVFWLQQNVVVATTKI